ncbi:MAG: carbohydrate ABC transporter permease [Nonomuraea sp.]|nr:carbohydrate ABC transporter permease [Streptomyces sp.]NUP84051.1 carbohydrate ABC transporter permease [Nonomuraea sp.]
MVVTVISSLKPPVEASASPPVYWPSALSGGNYAKLFSQETGFTGYLLNSLVVSLVTVVLTVVVSVLAGYGFARFRFPARGALFGLILAVLMIPYPTLLIPLYVILTKIGLGGNTVGVGLVLTMFQLPFGIYMMRNSFESVPRGVEEAATMDGATVLATLRHVLLPIVRPGIVTVGLYAFVNSWNEFLAPLIFLTDSSSYTLPIALLYVQQGQLGTIDYGALQAGVTTTMLPCVLIFLLLQRYYVSGLIAGAVKS